jgi:hypothetical protein
MHGFEILIPILAIATGGLIILTPLVAFSARFALKPIMQAVAQMRESRTSAEGALLQDRRIALLEAEVQELREVVQRLAEVEEFRRQLEAPGADGAGAARSLGAVRAQRATH